MHAQFISWQQCSLMHSPSLLTPALRPYSTARRWYRKAARATVARQHQQRVAPLYGHCDRAQQVPLDPGSRPRARGPSFALFAYCLHQLKCAAGQAATRVYRDVEQLCTEARRHLGVLPHLQASLPRSKLQQSVA